MRKISETVEQVEELRKELSRKNTELTQKNNLASEKLKQVVKDQQEAENKKKVSRKIRLVNNGVGINFFLYFLLFISCIRIIKFKKTF